MILQKNIKWETAAVRIFWQATGKTGNSWKVYFNSYLAVEMSRSLGSTEEGDPSDYGRRPQKKLDY
jgi:hypothetical protein